MANKPDQDLDAEVIESPVPSRRRGAAAAADSKNDDKKSDPAKNSLFASAPGPTSSPAPVSSVQSTPTVTTTTTDKKPDVSEVRLCFAK